LFLIAASLLAISGSSLVEHNCYEIRTKLLHKSIDTNNLFCYSLVNDRNKQYRFTGEHIMKRTIALLVATIVVLVSASIASATYWGYAQESTIKQQSRAYVRQLQAQGIDAQFKFYEDGSWHIVGCVSDGLCQD
jgi:hypothetical protein